MEAGRWEEVKRKGEKEEYLGKRQENRGKNQF